MRTWVSRSVNTRRTQTRAWAPRRVDMRRTQTRAWAPRRVDTETRRARYTNVKNAKIRVKELFGREGEIRVGNQQRERERQGKRVSGTHVFLGEKGKRQFLVSPSFGRKIREDKEKEKERK